MKITDLFFKLDNLESFTYTFKHDSNEYTEIVYGYVSEILESDSEDNPEKINVSQIINLELFIKGEDTTTIDRVFEVSDLSPNPQFKRQLGY